jgi:uncharacterized protein (TIGR03083 family)
MSAVWDHVKAERLATADFLEGLTPEEWDAQSLCPEWKVRDVAAHLAWGSTLGVGEALLGLLRSGFRFNRFNAEDAKRRGEQAPATIVARLREVAPHHSTPPGVQAADLLADVLCHNIDIRRPLGKPRPMPPEPFVLAADRLKGNRYPFGTRKRIAGLRLIADDVAWSTGDGPDVRGTSEAILMILSGRAVGADELTGDGATRLYERFPARVTGG